MLPVNTLLLFLLFTFQSTASPWGAFGALKRAFAEGNQVERRGESSSGGYGQWSPTSETGGAQQNGWSTKTVTTTEESWKTTTAQGGEVTSWKTTTEYQTTEKYETSTVTETQQETCSAASPSTIFQTIVSTVQGPGSTVTRQVTQQVPTTILSTIISSGSCTPVGPVRIPLSSVCTLSFVSHLLFFTPSSSIYMELRPTLPTLVDHVLTSCLSPGHSSNDVHCHRRRNYYYGFYDCRPNDCLHSNCLSTWPNYCVHPDCILDDSRSHRNQHGSRPCSDSNCCFDSSWTNHYGNSIL